MSKRPQITKYIDAAVRSLSTQEADSLTQQANGTFLFEIKYEDGIEYWTIDLKTGSPQLFNGKPANADVTISTDEAAFVKFFEGKSSAQTLITEGKMKINGDMTLASKLDLLFKSICVKTKL